MQAASSQTETKEVKKRGAFAEVFGQFATREFWKEFTKTLVQEAIATFLMALGGVIYWHGKDKKNKDMGGVEANQAQASSKAFGSGYAPNPSFFGGSSHNSNPAPPSPSGDGRYPGF